jgi:photosystem II stability/assembly factor-like uncharacterized protein
MPGGDFHPVLFSLTAAWARATGLHGDGGGIFLSEDAGKTWKQVLDKDRHIYDVTVDPADSSILYAAGHEGTRPLCLCIDVVAQ